MLDGLQESMKNL